MTFSIHFSVLLGFIINYLYNTKEAIGKFIEDIFYEIGIFILRFIGFYYLLPAGYVNSEIQKKNNILDNFDYFSDGDNNNRDNNEDYNNNSDSNNNPNNNEDSNSNSDDVEMSNTQEVYDHNAPEEIMDDLDNVDRARRNDPNALDELKREYPAFFEGKTDKEGLDDLESYLEEEFPVELKKSELEADAEEAQAKADSCIRKAEIVERIAEQLTDPEEKANLRKQGEDYRKTAEEETKRAEALDAQSKGRSNNSNNNDGNDSSGPSGPSSGPSGSGTGPSGTGSGPSDSGPSNSSGGTLSQILVILGGFVETILKVFENMNM